MSPTQPALAADAELHVGCVFGQYRIDELLGRGGMGAVYRGMQLSIDRPVAVKVIAADTENNHEYVLRFRREAQAMAKLRHPNTVRLLDFGVTEQGRMFMVMELLRGVDLQQRQKSGPLPLIEALRIVRQIAQSLSEAHAIGIVHRDLKPGNVFLSEVEGGDCFVKVMDFGVAGYQADATRSALTLKGAVLGTAAYMSPEQAQGTAVDTRADLYSLGVTLFEMLAGRLPFQSDSAVSLLVAHMHDAPPRLLEVRPDVRGLELVQPLLDRLLAKSPDERPATAADVIAIVDALLLDLGAPITASNGVDVATRASRARSRTPLTLGALLVSASIAGALLSWQHPGKLAALRVHAESIWGRSGSLAANAAGRAMRWVDSDDAAVASVTIASLPSGATVKLAGAVLGKTPYQLQMKQKTEIQLTLSGYAPQTLAVEPKGEPNVVVNLVRSPQRRSKPRRAP